MPGKLTTLLAAVGAAGTLVALAPMAQATPTTPSTPTTGMVAQQITDTVADPTAYWTPERMASAVPMDAPADERPGTSGAKAAALAQDAAPATVAEPAPVADPTTNAVTPDLVGRHFKGLRYVGTFFSVNGGVNHSCTASVVNSRHGDLLLTAAHCTGASMSNAVFVPKYHDGLRPYGSWPLSTVFVDSRWTASHDMDLDFAFVLVGRVHGHTVQSVVGGNGLVINRGFVNVVTVVGYPARSHEPPGVDSPIICTNKTSRWETYRYQVEFDCDGYPGGTSGSPWILDFNPWTGYGYTNGDIGGYMGGGPNDNISTTSYFDHDIAKLYHNAVANSRI